MLDEIGDSCNKRHVFVAQRTFQCVQLHLGEDEILTDLIMQIPRDFFSFLFSDTPKLGSEGFGNLIKFWKPALFEASNRASFLADVATFFPGLCFSEYFFSRALESWRP